MDNSYIPSKRRIPAPNVKFTLCHSTRITQPNVNLPLINYRMSDKTALAIQKANQIFHKQLEHSRQYLSQFGSRVENVYKKQLYRSYLKQRQYQGMLTELQKQNVKYQQKLSKLKSINQLNYKPIMDQVDKLQNLKKSYQEFLIKQNQNLEKQNRQYELLCSKNNQVKEKIKYFWKCIGNHQSKQSLHESKSRKNSIFKQKSTHSKKKIKRKTFISQKTVKEEDQSLYITKHIMTENQKKDKETQSQRKIDLGRKSSLIMEKLNLKIQIEPNLERIKTKIDDSGFSHYDNAIRQIQQLEMSIINCKKDKKKNCKGQKQTENSSLQHMNLRKQKIKDRIRQVQNINQMIKLFIVFLKSNQTTENRTGLENLRKIICYFQSHLQNKEEMLSTIKHMGKSLGI